MPFHDSLPPPAWHGAKVDSGTLAARPIPSVIGQLYFVTSGANAGKVYIAEGTTAQTDWKEIADINTTTSSGSLEVRDLSNSINVDPTTRLIFPDNTLSNTATGEVTVDFPSGMEIGDFDFAQATSSSVNKLLFTEHSIVYASSNEYHIDSPVRVGDDLNGYTSNVRVIKFPDGTVTSPNPNEVFVDVSSSGPSGPSFIPYLASATNITNIWQSNPLSSGKYTEDFFDSANILRANWHLSYNSYSVQFNNGLQPEGVFLVTCNIYLPNTLISPPPEFTDIDFTLYAEVYDAYSVTDYVYLKSAPFAGDVIDYLTPTKIGQAALTPSLMFSHCFFVDANTGRDFRLRFFINGDETVLDDWKNTKGLIIRAYVSITQVR